MRKALLYFCAIIFVISIITGQTKHIGFWVEYVDYDGEYENMLDALDGGPFDYELHEFWDYTAITTDSLNSIDVFIVPECEMSGGYTADSLAGAFLGPIIRPWVNSGGLFMGFYRHGVDFINAAGFTPIGGSYSGTTSSTLNLVLPTHPMAEGVASTFTGMNASLAYPDYTGYTPVVMYSGTKMHTGFEERGAGCVVFMGCDYYYSTTPNQDKLFQNAVNYWGMRSEGPILQSFFPPEGSYVSSDTPVVMAFEDEDGVELSSVQVYINDLLITGYDPAMSLSGDSIFIDLADTFSDGAVTVRIRRVEDALGHEGPDTTREFVFYLDKTPPVITYREPEGMYSHIPTGSWINFEDEMSGSSAENWYFYIADRDTVKPSTPGVITENDTTAIIAFFLTGTIIPPNDTVWIEFGVWDTPDIGEPNIERYTWWFCAAVGIEETGLPGDMELSVYPNPFNSAVNIRFSVMGSGFSGIEIYDINGRMVAEILATGSESAKPSSTTASGVCRWTPDESIGSGIYLVRAVSTDGPITKKIVYLK
ncbi:hypothetical protein DRQ36_04855 [bacterium]|nr:MAG: hypothetical protein DRQ36_04855 [bacterium]